MAGAPFPIGGLTMSGWAGSDRKQRLPDDWEKRRQRILRRDGGRCTWILSTGDGTDRCPELATDVDHIRRGDDHREENLRSLCNYHHAQKSSGEGAAALRAKIKRKLAQFDHTEAHPGLNTSRSDGATTRLPWEGQGRYVPPGAR